MDIQVFKNQGFGIRGGLINGEPYFVLADVCKALGLEQVSRVKDRLKEDGVITNKVIDSLGRTQEATFINESNLYKTIFQSRKEEALQFQDWVTSEVLPSIRKTGAYHVGFKLPQTYAEALRALADESEAKEKALALIEEQKPKVEFYEAVTGSKDTIDVGQVAKVLNKNIGRTKLFALLREKGVLMSNNIPYQKYCDNGYFRVIESKYTKPDGSTHIGLKTVVYQKGVNYINKLLGA